MNIKGLKYYITPILLALNISLVGCASAEDIEVVESETIDIPNEDPKLEDELEETSFEETSTELEEISSEEASTDLEEENEGLESDSTLEGSEKLATIEKLDIEGNEKHDGYQISFTSIDGTFQYATREEINEVRTFLEPLIFTDTSVVCFSNCSDLDIVTAIPNTDKIKSVVISVSSIDSLDFLEDYKNLESLRIQNCPHLENIEGLRNLTKLKKLVLFGTSVSDIGPLSNLKDIVYLDLTCNQIEDVTPLKNLSKLEHANLTYNEIKEADALDFLVERGIITDYQKNLIIATYWKDYIAITTEENSKKTSFDQLFIERLKSKEKFGNDKYYIEIRDENGNSCLYTLIDKDIHPYFFKNTYNQVTLVGVEDLSILEEIKNKDSVTSLSILSSEISTLENLPLFQNLESIGIGNCNSLSDISRLESMPNISTIVMRNTSISDITALSSLENLKAIWLSYTYVEDLTPLLTLPNLEQGCFSWNRITDFNDFVALQNRGVKVQCNIAVRNINEEKATEYTK